MSENKMIPKETERRLQEIVDQEVDMLSRFVTDTINI